LKTGLALIAALLILGLVSSVNTVNAVTYYSAVTIEEAEGGYTLPSTGTYYYPASATLLRIYAYHYEGYSFTGWMINSEYWATAYNPIEISLNIGSENVTYSIKPVFSTTPYYVLNLTSIDNISVFVNDKSVKAYNHTFGGGLVNIAGGTTVTIKWPTTEYYDFVSYVVNGTELVTTPNFSFTMNGNTTITVNEELHTPASISTYSWLDFVSPTMVCLILGFGFSQVGDKLGEHTMAGFLIGGGIGLIICAMYALIPVWIATVAYIFATIAVYFWFKGND
jgi:hypothetical protein